MLNLLKGDHDHKRLSNCSTQQRAALFAPAHACILFASLIHISTLSFCPSLRGVNDPLPPIGRQSDWFATCRVGFAHRTAKRTAEPTDEVRPLFLSFETVAIRFSLLLHNTTPIATLARTHLAPPFVLFRFSAHPSPSATPQRSAAAQQHSRQPQTAAAAAADQRSASFNGLPPHVCCSFVCFVSLLCSLIDSSRHVDVVSAWSGTGLSRQHSTSTGNQSEDTQQNRTSSH